MRKVIYGAAMSVDGYIAGPNGEYDWIVMDLDMDFAEMMAQFDTFLIGRKTFEAMGRMGNASRSTPGIQNIVFSRTLKPSHSIRTSPSVLTPSVWSPNYARSLAKTSLSSEAGSCSGACWRPDWLIESACH